MKVIRKDKVDRKLRNARKNNKKIRGLIDFHYDDLFFILWLITALVLIVGSLMAFVESKFFLLPCGIGLVGFVTFLYYGPFFTRFKYHHDALSKIDQEIKKLEKENLTLKIEDNYQTYFNELIKLKGTSEIEKIEPTLIQDIIETYRKKDSLNLPKFKNEDRVNHFMNNELRQSCLIKEEEIELLNMETN
tara:strand:+ start:28482 stop:29051 length:570 start_codon:yes stop_codon:yes gene_type:complete